MYKAAGGGPAAGRWEDNPLAAAREALARSSGAEEPMRIAVDDLMPGAGGEVVLFNDSAVHEIILETRERPVERGEVEARTTEDGIEVSGFHFVRFADGLVVYHDPDTVVRVAPPSDDLR